MLFIFIRQLFYSAGVIHHPTGHTCLHVNFCPTGNGVCINSMCVCNENFTGVDCDCPRDTSNCRGCLENVGLETYYMYFFLWHFVNFCVSVQETSVCSGEGTCVCGTCVCRNYSLRFGQFCEECGVRGILQRITEVY